MNKLVYIAVLVMGFVFVSSAENNDSCTICYCLTCPLGSDDCQEIIDAVSDIADETKKKKHVQALHEIYVQQNDKCRRAAEELQKKLMEERPELEELD